MSALSLALAELLSASPAPAQSTVLVSVDSRSVQGNGFSGFPSLAADGRFVAFGSEADNLVPGDTNGVSDVFVHDHRTGMTIRVSVESSGLQGNGPSGFPVISADGHSVVFGSAATNLVPGDTNGVWDAFLHDLRTGRTSRVSVGSLGTQASVGGRASGISADGRIVAFESISDDLAPGDSNGEYDIFVHDLNSGSTTLVSKSSLGTLGNGRSLYPFLSADGRFVAFESGATNLVIGDTNGNFDVFVHELSSAQTHRVSVDSLSVEGDGRSGAARLSADSRYVAFESTATNLSPGDTNGTMDVFVHDRQISRTTRVSVDSAGTQSNGQSYSCAISPDGRWVVFSSYASNLVPMDTNRESDVFSHDTWRGLTDRLSLDSGGGQGNGSSAYPSISATGRFVAFQSRASNLILGDLNSTDDVFIRDRGRRIPSLLVDGACPGMTTLTVHDATPHRMVVLVHGQSGSHVRPASPCAGLVLAVTAPVLGDLRIADGSGTSRTRFYAAPGACGRTVQAVDVDSCTVSNAVVM